MVFAQRQGLDVAWMMRVDEALNLIAENPENLRRAVLRQFPFAIYYEVSDQEIVVFAVYHSRRDPERLTSRF